MEQTPFNKEKWAHLDMHIFEQTHLAVRIQMENCPSYFLDFILCFLSSTPLTFHLYKQLTLHEDTIKAELSMGPKGVG